MIKNKFFRPDSPLFRAPISESDGLLRRQINDDKAIHAGLSAILQKFLLSVSQHRVVVSHKKDWCSQALSPGFPHHLEGRGDGDSVLEGLLCDNQKPAV